MQMNVEYENIYSYDKSKLFQTLVDILVNFDLFCKRNHLKYYAFAGTLLGTIRHKGIIPWDDDIDVVMMRDDYNKMLSLVRNSGLDSKYQFLNSDIDQYFPKAFTRLTNIDTTEIPLKDAMYKYNHGCFIDIFPLDYIPEGKMQKFLFFRKTDMLIQLLHIAGRQQSNTGPVGMSKTKALIYAISFPLNRTGILSVRKISARLNKHASRYNNKRSYCKKIGTVVFSSGNSRFIYNINEYLNGFHYRTFENTTICVPDGYDSILKNSYGDYMTPVQQQSEHGDTIINLEVGYKTYIEAHYQELQKLFISTRKLQK